MDVKKSGKMSGDSGWNAVIHHPSELELQNWNWDENDGETERELPSTVDMDAIKGGSWNPATGPNGIIFILKLALNSTKLQVKLSNENEVLNREEILNVISFYFPRLFYEL